MGRSLQIQVVAAAMGAEARGVGVRAAVAKVGVRVVVEMVVGVRVAAAMEEVMGVAEKAAVAMAAVAMAAVAKVAARAAAVRAAAVVGAAAAAGTAAGGVALVVAAAVRNWEEMAARTVGWALWVAVADRAARRAVGVGAVAATAVVVKAVVVKEGTAACRE